MSKPNDRVVSFNQWLKLEANRTALPDLAALAQVWVSRRGRLTRDSVEARAVTEYGCAPGVGTAAYDAYVLATSFASSDDVRVALS